MRLAIGTAQFGSKYGITNKYGIVDKNKAKSILSFAKSNQIDTLDTAYEYNGAHELLGSLKLKDFKIISKLPQLKNLNLYENLKKTVIEILTSLKLERIDGLLIHHTIQLSNKNGNQLWSALSRIKDEGYVKYIGYSLYNVEELNELYFKFKPDIVQIPGNIFDQRFFTSGWVQKLYDENVLIFLRSIFLQGLLLLPSHKLPNQFLTWKPLWINLDNWLKNNNLSSLEACLNFFLNDNRIFKIIVGVENKSQLEEILNIKKKNIDYPNWMNNNDEKLLNPSLWKITNN